MSQEPFVSFVVPVYNEEQNISNVLQDLYSVVEANPHWQSEVIVVEDGSGDRTREVIQKLAGRYPSLQLILHAKNRGYTPSLKDGIQRARGKYVMYVGADEEFDCSEIPLFVNPLLDSGPGHADVVLGVRWQRNAYQLARFFISVIYIFLLNYLFRLRVNDYNWSQAWPREFFDRVTLRSRSLFVLPEIIIRANDLKYKIKEIPSNHRGRRTGKSSVNLAIMGFALWEALQFWRYRQSSGYSVVH